MPLDAFLPAVRDWFQETLGEPTPPQRDGWPAIRRGEHVLIAAPTGSGKTLAAFLHALDNLLAQGERLGDTTQVLYVSPLRALGNDIQKNLRGPLAAIAERDPTLPEIRVLVRTGDTPASERAAMGRRPPHILVTTPESLYILLTSQGGRGILQYVRTVIVDEIHSLARDKRGSHLALSLERLEALAGPVQRIGLSATQKPLERVASLLVGVGRPCTLLDTGHLREMDLAVEIPESPLATVCSHETFEEIYRRMGALILEHRTTLVFVNTRKMAERVAARLTDQLGEEQVGCHHSSLSKERRFDAEQRLKAGTLRALVATASLELGIDVGDVDLAVQLGATRSIATFLQRVGRSGHAVRRVPKGRLFPLTQDELVEAFAMLRSVTAGVLDETPAPPMALDILAQQSVAACVAETWSEDELFATWKRAWPFRDLERGDFDKVIALHLGGRAALLHRDGVGQRLRGTRRARIPAVTAGGAIPDNADYRVVLEPSATFIGTLNEDFAIESSAGDIVQLGNASWRILKVEQGVIRVADAEGAPPTLPFWLGEAPGRTRELSAAIGDVRESGTKSEDAALGLPEGASNQLREYLEEGRLALGCVPTQRRVVLERFFDESGGMQMVLHAPFGARINRAFGLALRKRFCRGFGFELQAAANDEAIVLSLGPHHSFPLEDVFDYLHPNTAREVLVQAVLATPMFKTRWRWNVCRALVVSRTRAGSRVPAPLLRMRAEDALVQAFPDVMACGENLPPGNLEVPIDHPLVRQTLDDCLTEAMDVEGFLELLRGLRDGSIEKVAIDTPEPSAFCRGILNAAPYAFLDDAPLEERRTQAVLTRRTLDPATADGVGALDQDAVARVQREAWPDPRDAEELHEALLWMGFVTEAEALPWQGWLDQLRAACRVVLEDDRYYAVEASRDPKELLRGRMEVLGPVASDDPLLFELEREGVVLRTRWNGAVAWCDRRLLARIHRYTVERLRQEIEPVSTEDYLRFLARWLHLDTGYRLEGPMGVLTVLKKLAGFAVPVALWEKEILARRVQDYRRQWLDELTLSGEMVFGRLFGSGASPIRSMPLCIVPRDDLQDWFGLTDAPDLERLSGSARQIEEILAQGGAMFPQELARKAGLPPAFFEAGVAELIGAGALTADSFAALRQFIMPPSKRRGAVKTIGRWSLFRREPVDPPSAEFVARRLLDRYGVLFRRVIQRERISTPWRDIARSCRTLELRGEIRGGRFVSGHSGEQFALPLAIPELRKARREAPHPTLEHSAADPVALLPILAAEVAR